MMERRWKIAFSIGTVVLAFAFLARLIRFYRDWYDMPVAMSKTLSASLGYVNDDWPNLLFGLLLLAGMAANLAIAKKRATQLK